MAYPTVSSPYGLKPINLIGGQPYAGSTRNLPIQYGYATDIGYGDLLELSRGTVVKSTITTSSASHQLIGVFLGCSYTNPLTKQKMFSQYWPSGTLAGDAYAVVADDPDLVFQIAVCSATTVLASSSVAMIGQNYGLIQNAVNLNTGDSTNAALYSSTTTTSALPLRVVGLVGESATSQTATGSSSSTTITLTGSGLASAIPVGTDVSYIAANGQLIGTGSYVSVAATAGATSITINAAIAVPGSVVAIPSSSTIVFIQYPEVKVKINFGSHEYLTATAI